MDPGLNFDKAHLRISTSTASDNSIVAKIGKVWHQARQLLFKLKILRTHQSNDASFEQC
jgi:hypothetical protein